MLLLFSCCSFLLARTFRLVAHCGDLLLLLLMLFDEINSNRYASLRAAHYRLSNAHRTLHFGQCRLRSAQCRLFSALHTETGAAVAPCTNSADKCSAQCIALQSKRDISARCCWCTI